LLGTAYLELKDHTDTLNSVLAELVIALQILKNKGVITDVEISGEKEALQEKAANDNLTEGDN